MIVIEIDGPLWFFAALMICSLLALYLRALWGARRLELEWWRDYEAKARQQYEESMLKHEEFMCKIDEIDRAHSLAWGSSAKGNRGQA